MRSSETVEEGATGMERRQGGFWPGRAGERARPGAVPCCWGFGSSVGVMWIAKVR